MKLGYRIGNGIGYRMGYGVGAGNIAPPNALRDSSGQLIMTSDGQCLIPIDNFDFAARYPSAPSLEVDSDTQVTVSWTNNGTQDYDDVEIAYSADGVTYPYALYAAPGETSKAITGFTAYTTVYVKVRYRKNCVYSAFSDAVNAVTGSV